MEKDSIGSWANVLRFCTLVVLAVIMAASLQVAHDFDVLASPPTIVGGGHVSR